jgi:sugar/nucleoside kinase (ribokinase family)
VQRVETSIAADGPMVAATLAALDVPALTLTNDLGDDLHGAETRSWLDRHQVATVARVVPGTLTPHIVIIADERGTRTWFPYLPGVAEALASIDLAPLVAASFAYIDCYQLIETAAVRAVRAARAAGVPVLVNLGGSALSPPVASAIRGCHDVVIQTNVDDTEHEAAPTVAASLLQATGARWVVVTAGASGAIAVGDEVRLWVPAFEVRVRHTHCAGAAFSGGLIYGLLHGRPMRDALDLAAASGALRCERAHDEALPSLTELVAFIASRGHRPTVAAS